MIKILKYFIESVIIYSFFTIIKLFGLTYSRKLFAFIFKVLGPVIRSNKVAFKNIEIFSKNISEIKKREIVKTMWSNYGMTFVEYMFLKKFRNSNSHIEVLGEDFLKKAMREKKTNNICFWSFC